MENTASKPEVLKPIILKAGIPLAVSVAGFIYAYFMAKKNLSYKAPSFSSNEANENNSSQEPKHEESCHGLTSIEDEEERTTTIEQEISGLRNRIESMQMRELALSLMFDRFCELKDKESLLVEIKNMFSLESDRVDLYDREISSMETENKKLENFVVEYLSVVEKIEYLKGENRVLQRKVNKLLRKSKAQNRLAKGQALKIKAEEANNLRIRDDLETKSNAIDALKDEIRELQRALDEKNEIPEKLDAAEKSCKSKIEAKGLSREEYKQVLDELEKVKVERAAEAKELIYLRWTNACLKHDLMMPHEQNHNHQNRDHVEVAFEGSDKVMHYDSQHELHNSHLEHHDNVPSSDEHHHKRTKLLGRLKKWVEGSDKKRVRPSVTRGAEKTQVLVRRSCSSTIV